VGFPDIGTIEPLADALDVSVIELMRAGEVMSTHEADEACKGALDLTKAQVEREIRDVVMLIAVLAVVTMLVEMLSSLRWNGSELMMTMSVPLTYPLIPGALVAYAIWRGVHGKTWRQAASVGIVLLVAPRVAPPGSVPARCLYLLTGTIRCALPSASVPCSVLVSRPFGVA
jgi:hypothetical protein